MIKFSDDRLYIRCIVKAYVETCENSMLKPGPGISALGEHNDSKLIRCLDVHTQQVKALPMVDYAGSKRSTILLPINCSSLCCHSSYCSLLHYNSINKLYSTLSARSILRRFREIKKQIKNPQKHVMVGFAQHTSYNNAQG
jgi:hypothetical protein